MVSGLEPAHSVHRSFSVTTAQPQDEVADTALLRFLADEKDLEIPEIDFAAGPAELDDYAPEALELLVDGPEEAFDSDVLLPGYDFVEVAVCEAQAEEPEDFLSDTPRVVRSLRMTGSGRQHSKEFVGSFPDLDSRRAFSEAMEVVVAI
jgi:hypothetical protein